MYGSTNSDWITVFDPRSGKNYYANTKTRETSWYIPHYYNAYNSYSTNAFYKYDGSKYPNSSINNKKCDSSSSSKYKHIYTWLPTRKLLESFNEEYINNNNEFMNDIIYKIFGNWKRFIFYLINNGNENQINYIYKILKNEKIKYDQQQFINDDKKKENEEKSNFDILSTTSITNICSYLTKNDINSFKLTSSFIALQCLLEMKKYQNIGTFNMNELYFHYKYKYLSYLLFLSHKKAFKYDRYNISTIQNSSNLLQILSNKYNISIKYILLLHSKYSPKFTSFIDILPHLEIVDAKDFDENNVLNDDRWKCSLCTCKNIKTAKYCTTCGNLPKWRSNNNENNKHFIMLFDKRNVMTMNNKKLLTSDIKINNDSHIILLINYFDIKQQTVQFIRTLMVKKYVSIPTLIKYIKNNIKLLLNDIINNNDMNELLDIINTNNESIKFWTKSSIPMESYDKMNKNTILIFQINDNKYINKYEYHYKYILNETFYRDPHILSNDLCKKLKLKQELNKRPQQQQLNDLDKLSSSIIQNICSFLSKSDIYNFKLLSLSISIICLKEMRKIEIKSFNMTDLSTFESYNDFECLRLTFKKLMNSHRYYKWMNISLLLQKWSKIYNIPKKQIILFQTTLDIRQNQQNASWIKAAKNNPHALRGQIIKVISF